MSASPWWPHHTDHVRRITDDGNFTRIRRLGTEFSFTAGDVLKDGARHAPRSVILIDAGQVAEMHHGPDGQEVMLGIVGSRDLAGLGDVLHAYGQSRTATIALTEGRGFAISEKSIHRLPG